MTDPLEDRLRSAMREAAGNVHPRSATPGARAELVAGLVQRRERRQRRRTAAAGTVASVLLAGVGAAITLPRVLASQPGQQVAAQGSASQPSTSPGPATKRDTSVLTTSADHRPRAALESPGTGQPAAAPSSTAAPTATGRSAGGGPPPVQSIPGTTQSTHSTTASSTGTLYPSGTGIAYPSGTVIHHGPQATTTTTIVTPPVSPTPYVVTQSDYGETIDLVVGQTLAVDLSGSEGFPWSEPASTNSNAVALESGSANPSTGDSYGLFRAVGTGKATIDAAQNPLCYEATPKCLLPSRRWTVTVDVTG